MRGEGEVGREERCDVLDGLVEKEKEELSFRFTLYFSLP